MHHLLFFGANSISLQAALAAKAQGLSPLIIADNGQMDKIAGEARAQGLDTMVLKLPSGIPPEIILPENQLAISIGAPWFFKADFLEHHMHGKMLNLHGTQLPRGRGGTLFSWQILSGQRSGVCLLHRMSERLDAGAVVHYEEFLYPAHCRKPADYIQYYERQNTAFLEKFIKRWATEGIIYPTGQQPEYLSTYWPRLRADVHAWVDWNWEAREIERFICAFDAPYGGARCRWRGQELILRDAWAESAEGRAHPFQWGIVVRNNGQWLTVAAREGEVLICDAHTIDGQSVLAEIQPGDRLHCLQSDIEKARKRIIKTARGLAPQPDWNS